MMIPLSQNAAFYAELALQLKNNRRFAEANAMREIAENKILEEIEKIEKMVKFRDSPAAQVIIIPT